MKSITIQDIKKELPILLLWNPLVVLLIFNSYAIAISSSIFILILTIFVQKYIKQEFVKVILFNFLCIVSIIGYSEVVFTYIHKEKVIPNLYESRGKYYFNKPFLKEVFSTSEFTSTYITNCQGYRIGKGVNPLTPINRCDILFIGDSFTQGAQVEYDEMFSSIIEDSVRNSKVVNAGISGAGIFDSYYYFIDEGYKLSPKYVVLQLCVFNDFFNVQPREIGFKEKLVEHSNLYRFLNYQINHSNNLKIGRYTEPFFEREDDNINYNILYKKSSDIKERDKSNLLKCLVALNKAVKTIGGELIVCLIPCKEQVSSKYLQEILCNYHIKIEDLDLQYPSKWFSEMTNQHNIKLVDLYEPFRNSEEFPYLTIDEHLNNVGHRIVANSLIQTLNNK